MNILALDMATRTGFAFRDKHECIHSGYVEFPVDKTRESPGIRWLKFSAWLKHLIVMQDIKIVAYEMPHMRGGASTTVGMGFQTTLHTVCADLGVDHKAYHSTAIKKHATGKGNADKVSMVEHACLKAGRPIVDDNEADAIHILSLAESELC